MQNHFTFLLFLLISGSVAATGLPHNMKYSCSYESKRRGTVGDLDVQLLEGKIQSIEYGNYTSGLPGMIGYHCRVAADRTDKGQKWSEDSNGVKVKFEGLEGQRGNVFTIRRDSRGMMIDMREAMDSGPCGAGSSLPDYIYLPFESKTCKVKYGNY